MKILIMVLSHNDNGIYNQLVETIRATWDSDIVKDVQTLYYYSNNSLDSIKMYGDCLFIPCEDGIHNLGYKVLKSFEYVLENIDFDYIYKMNCSSYLNKSMLRDIVESNQREILYGGFLGRHNDINFASGAGTLLSKYLVKYIVDNQETWDHSLVEDVAIGKLLHRVSILPMDRVSIVDGVDTDKLNTKCYHYRCKNDNNREMDIIIIRELHNRYKNNK
jgi:hypothetical protein